MTSPLAYLLLVAALTELLFSQTFRHVIDDDNDLNQYLAFPIDECIKVSLILSKYVKYTCSDVGVEKRLYADDGCQTLIADQIIEYWNSADKSPCGGDKFSCDGEDRWVNVGYWVGSCTGVPVLNLPAVMGCHCNGANSSYDASCSEAPLSGSMINYNDSVTCNGTIEETNDLSECEYSLTAGSLQIYTQVYDCRLSDPTTEPTEQPTWAPTVKDLVDLDNLDDVYKVVALVFVLLFVLIGGVSFVDAWWIRPNDYFRIGALGAMMIQTVDMLSDCFFSAEAIHQYGLADQDPKKKPQLLAIFLISILFIAFPAFLALFQLYSQAKKHWLKSDYVRSWLSKYFTILLFMSLATGSSFSAVSLLNSYIFHLEIFDMGLTDKQLKRFNTRRIWSVVVFENCPQLVLQTYFLILQGGSIFSHLITVSSMVMSLVSIVISVMGMTMERAINKTQRSVTISMDVTGEWIEQEASRCRTMNYQLRKKLAPLLGVDWNTIEVVKPMYVHGGLSLDIIVYVNEGFENWDTTLDEANVSGKLPKIFVEAWKIKMAGNLLMDPAEMKGITISNIQWRVTESKEDVKIRAASSADGNTSAGFKSTASVSSMGGRVPSLRSSDVPGSKSNGKAIEAIAEQAPIEIEMAEKKKEDVEQIPLGPPPAYNAKARPAPRRKVKKRTKAVPVDEAAQNN